MMMKNRVANSQINGIDYRKKLIHNQVLCEAALVALKKIYWHEKELLIAIPILLRSAQTFLMVDSLTVLKQYTLEHVKQLEKDFPGIEQITPLKKTYDIICYKNIT